MAPGIEALALTSLAFAAVAGVYGTFWLGAGVFLAGAVVVWLRVKPRLAAAPAETPAGG